MKRYTIDGVTLGCILLWTLIAGALLPRSGQAAQDEKMAVTRILDDWHAAAAAADEERYFSHFTPDAVFMGTDATERWKRDKFREWAKPYFDRGRAWNMMALERHIMLSPQGDVAWFDEELKTEKLGPCRGTGVLLKQDGTWKIAHYNLSIPIPNDIAPDVVEQISQALERAELKDELVHQSLALGSWRGWLESPGGELPFSLELARNPDGQLTAVIINDPERLEIPVVIEKQDELMFSIDYYDSTINARLSPDGQRLTGLWSKRSGPDKLVTLPFHAVVGNLPRFAAFEEAMDAAGGDARMRITGRWRMNFASSRDHAVGVFEQKATGELHGTILTTTGDYRYLVGAQRGRELRLSVFDGAHAFLFHAVIQPDGSLQGDFWSGDSWHETWTAVRDESAALPDGFTLTRAVEGISLGHAAFPDVTGSLVSLDDPSFDGKVRIIEVFGTWCPNCRDATRLLTQLDREYRAKGLSILGLAFEATGDFDRDAAQVRKYADRMQISYPLLVAGTRDKAKAAAALPFLDGIRAYPTTVFLDRHNRVRAVYSGFSGPATGKEYERLVDRFRSQIESLLAESE